MAEFFATFDDDLARLTPGLLEQLMRLNKMSSRDRHTEMRNRQHGRRSLEL
jgi:hypothetical protein